MVDEHTGSDASTDSAATEQAPKITVTRRTRTTTTPRKRATPAAEAPAAEAPAAVVAAPVQPTEAPAPAVVTTRTRRTTKKAATPEVAPDPDSPAVPAKKTARKATAKKTTAKKAAPAEASPSDESTQADAAAAQGDAGAAPRKSAKKAVAKKPATKADGSDTIAEEQDAKPAKKTARKTTAKKAVAPSDRDEALEGGTEKKSGSKKKAAAPPAEDTAVEVADTTGTDEGTDASDAEEGEDGTSSARRRRRRGGRRRRPRSDEVDAEAAEDNADEEDSEGDDAATSDAEESSSRRRRRNRRREGDGTAGDPAESPNTVTRVRTARKAEDEITAVTGSTRLEAKKQRRREGREAGRRRAPIVSEAEFLARRESVERVMAIRQRSDLTQIAVLEDRVLVEHYVARESQTSMIGNVYLGRVQNVLPSMEAAFIDIGRGRNAVLYAGEVNWSGLGHKEGTPRKIESVLSSGQTVLVQVTKDPVGNKGARLTSQISLAGRFLVYVPDGTTSGISRKLPDTERNRLKTLLRDIVPESAGVIVRTAAEGAAEDELTRDVERLKARWEDIDRQSKSGQAPKLLYGEPDLMLKVVRDLFTEDFAKLVVQGDDAWDTVHGYVTHVAPDLIERLEKYDSPSGTDIFATYRVDEQIKKGLDRKVWLPSGGSLIIDRTEAMTVVDVNTGKFTGQGGNLEETVTKNNLEAAEEIVRQLRLRDIGGIIVVDFIDMVLESNRDLVLRRLVECLGRDRTRHQVAEVTSLGLVQMTRKRIGTGLVEAFSHECEVCKGRGVVLEEAPVDEKPAEDAPRSRRTRGRRSGESSGTANSSGNGNASAAKPSIPSPKDVAAAAAAHEAETKSPEDSDAAAPAVEVASETSGAATAEVHVQVAPAAEEPADSAEVPAEPAGADAEPKAKSSRRRRTTKKVADPETAQAEISAAEPEVETEDVTPQEVDAATLPEVPVAAETDTPETDLAASPTPESDAPDSDAPQSDAPAFEIHVPVKKRGTRKR